MDNFEYSIQINDRDWEEFYSTAEECGLMQASLAKEEELWLSDTEHEDTSNCMPSSKHKFIRVSLCPPPPPEEYPALQISQPVVSQSVQTSNRWLGLNEDLLSGSEDEEEFASVTRFLCQKEDMMQKKESEQRIDIPLPKPVCQNKVIYPPNKHSRIISVEEDLVEYMRTLNLDRNVNYKVDPWQNKGKTTMDKSTNTEEELGHLGTEPMSIHPGGNITPNVNLIYSNNSSHCANNIERCSSANGQDENIPGVNRSGDEAIGKMENLGHQAPLLVSLNNCFHTEHGIFDSPAHLKELSSSKDGLAYYTMENKSFEVATKASVNSSAVEQNIPTSTIEELHSCISLSDNLNIVVNATPNTHNSVDCTTSTQSLAPFNITTRAWRNQTSLAPSSDSYRKPVLTLPEMYDFFFDDVSDTISRETESNMECKEGKPNLTLPEMYDFFFDDVSNTISRETESNMECKEGKPNLTLPEMYDFFFDDVSDMVSHKPESNMECKERKTDLTLPEMYEFFFDDVSDTVSRETESNMQCKEGIVYMPEMYEYFFIEDKEENRAKSKGDDTGQESSTDLASTSSVVATWPEACEFFFADGPQDQDRKAIMVSVPSSQVQSAADIIQSFVPKGLKGFTVRRAHTRGGPDGRLLPQEHPGTPDKSNISASGAIAPYLSPSRSDACLVFLALASWAVKSSDLQSSDGWKTALLANIGAVSAIGYLRRRSRRAWQDCPPQTGDET